MKCPASNPPDGGWGWMCVAGKLCCYICVMGTASAFGIIYIDLIDYFNSTREEAAWIGSLTFGLTLLAGPLASAMISRFGIQITTAAGSLLAFLGSFISWFATGMPYLYVSYGIMMGTGLCLVLVSSMVIVVQYFKIRIGLATAIGATGHGIGTLVLPPLYTYLLEQYGWRGTMLLLSGLNLHGLICAVVFIPPPHLKSSSRNNSSEEKTTAFCSKYTDFNHNPCHLLFTVGSGMTFLGYIVPFVHIPDMAVLSGIDKQRAAYLVSIMGVSNVIGRIFFGWISDLPCVNVISLQGASLMLCGVVTVVCPHFTQFYALAVYSMIFGVFIGVVATMLPVALVVLVGVKKTGDFLGKIYFIGGIMNIISSPLAGWLLDTTGNYNASFYVAGAALFLCGLMDMLVMVLHRMKKDRVEETVIQSNDNNQHTSETLESIRM